MHGDVLDRPALTERTEYELLKREWCPSIGVKHPAAMTDRSEVWGAITAHNPPTLTTTTAAKQGR
jgi:hypothetical protein